MPTYEYHCEKCDKNFDAFQSMKDDAYKVCPEKHCRETVWGQGKVKRLLGTGAGLIFKGSGFYITDYRSSGYKEAAKKDAAASSGGDAKPAASSDSKPAADNPKPAAPAADKPKPASPKPSAE